MVSAAVSPVDVVVIGGGHNGLTAAAYLQRAGYRVQVLERLDQVGGAAVSADAFDGVDARLSRYSYLVSLLPERIRQDLDLPISLFRRRFSSYTPIPGTDIGLLIDTDDDERTRESFRAIGAEEDFSAWQEFYRDTATVAQCLFPTMLDPLLTRSEVRSLLEGAAPGRRLYERFIEGSIVDLVESTFQHDVVRGVVLTDALIGTFPDHTPHEPLSVCFLYHVIGGGTGDWDVPIGGMGSVSGSLERAARDAGVEMLCGVEVTGVSPDSVVTYVRDGDVHQVKPRLVISGISRAGLDHLMGQGQDHQIEGHQVKVNIMLERLPRLPDPRISAEEAFSGTFHINESFEQLQTTIEMAQAGEIPAVIPCEVYCHSLSDRSILGADLQESTAQTLTVFALNVPHRLIAGLDPDTIRRDLQQRVLESLNQVLAEPIEDCVMRDANGELCIETKTTSDLERQLGLPGGNIFHEPLSWPFAEDDSDLHTPAQRWGVDSGHPGVLLAGSSARRGGGVSGIGGHNAAMAAREILGSV